MGYAPLDFTPGQGRFDRKPLSFSTSVQQGYDDNIYSSSGSPLQQPIKGSMLTVLSQGMDLLLSQSRLGLSLGANVGGQYYWDRSGDQLTPNGGLNLLFGYKITPRAQFSAVVNAIYTNQPTNSFQNGLTQSNGKGYLAVNSKFDLLYQWAPRFSTDTFYSANGTAYQSSSDKANNCLNQTVGQSLRYSLSKLVTGVLEGRYESLTFDTTLNSISRDSNTFYLLTGADVTLSRRFSGSFRVGDSIRNYSGGDQGSSSSPYGEASMSYALSKVSTMTLNGRYGFDDGSSSSTQKSKSTRVGLTYSQILSAKLRGTLGMNYSHIDDSQTNSATSAHQDSIDGTAGLQYALSDKFTLFGNYTHTRRTSADPLQEYTKNLYFLGASYQY